MTPVCRACGEALGYRTSATDLPNLDDQLSFCLQCFNEIYKGIVLVWTDCPYPPSGTGTAPRQQEWLRSLNPEDAGPMDDSPIDLEAERLRVVGELTAFRDRCLPAFFAPGGIVPVWDDDLTLGGPDVANRPLHRWQGAVDRLALVLVEPDTRLDRAEFEDFLFEEPVPDFSVRGGRLIWRVSLGLYCNREPDAWAFLTRMGLEAEVEGDPVEFLNARITVARDWLFGLGVDHPNLGDTLCTLLPLLVEGNTDVLKEILDPETWRSIVFAEERTTPEVRANRLRLIDVQLPRYLNNALLHVFGSLANNNFEVILDQLLHPHLLGGYTDLFPHYIFGVLLGKVEILRRLPHA